jgi:hypothetical protein
MGRFARGSAWYVSTDGARLNETIARPDLDLNNLQHSGPLETKAIRQAVRSGRLVSPEKCSICCGTGRIEAHHNDYHKPLDVEWLCRPCHLWFHRHIKRMNKARPLRVA